MLQFKIYQNNIKTKRLVSPRYDDYRELFVMDLHVFFQALKEIMSRSFC